MTTELRIYSKNYVTEDCVMTPSSGPNFPDRICDRDRDSQWVSDGADDDAFFVTFDVLFRDGETEVDRTFDRVILVNHNLKDVSIYYWDGSDWQLLHSETNMASGHTIIEVNETTSARIRIEMSTTQDADEEKAVGEFIVCASVIDGGTDLDNYKVSLNQKAVEVELADGSVHRTVFNTSLTRTCKYTMNARLSYLTKAQLEELRSLKEAGAAFLWQPEATERPEEIYLVTWNGPMAFNYASLYKGSGYVLELSLREV